MAAGPKGKPNILVIRDDDIGSNLSCYGADLMSHHTPSIDSIANEAMITNSYSEQGYTKLFRTTQDTSCASVGAGNAIRVEGLGSRFISCSAQSKPRETCASRPLVQFRAGQA